MTFAPTALLVLTHNVTGLKYFCKTTKLKTMHWYKGSGHYWKRHLKAHGRDVTIGLLGTYWDEKRCVNAALAFSKEHDIVNSTEWANLIDENGLSGAPSGKSHPMYGKPHPQRGTKESKLKGRYVGELNPMYGKPSAMLGKKNMGASLAHKGRKRPEGGGKPSKEVIATDVNGNKLNFKSISEAEKYIGASRGSIRKWCNMNKFVKNYTWEFAK